MKTHRLKIKDYYFNDLLEGSKTFELRKNDRNFKVGDLIKFLVIDIRGVIYTDDTRFIITYILKDVPQYGLDKDYCILGVKRK